MEKDVDINKVVRQHLEMEQFFSGFSLKGKAGTLEPRPSEGLGEPQHQDDDTAVAEALYEVLAYTVVGLHLLYYHGSSPKEVFWLPLFLLRQVTS